MNHRRRSVSAKVLLVVCVSVALAPVSSVRGEPGDAIRQYRLDPKLYDIWHGSKDRVYLTGIWKLKKLPQTRDNPPQDAGTTGGFAQPEYDDSSWPPAIVPWDVNLPYPPPANRRQRPKAGFSGVFWYRRTVDLPSRPPGTRALLFFGDVAEEADIFVNGRHVGSHKNSFVRGFRRGENIQTFTLDVTEAIRFGQPNTIAVRAFGLADRFDKVIGLLVRHALPPSSRVPAGDFLLEHAIGAVRRGIKDR